MLVPIHVRAVNRRSERFAGRGPLVEIDFAYETVELCVAAVRMIAGDGYYCCYDTQSRKTEHRGGGSNRQNMCVGWEALVVATVILGEALLCLPPNPLPAGE